MFKPSPARIDNIDFAVLSKVNELADRHGLKPYDFIATFRYVPAENRHVLWYETPASGNDLREERFFSMLKAIGADETTGRLPGTEVQIIDALDNALQLAPRKRF